MPGSLNFIHSFIHSCWTGSIVQATRHWRDDVVVSNLDSTATWQKNKWMLRVSQQCLILDLHRIRIEGQDDPHHKESADFVSHSPTGSFSSASLLKVGVGQGGMMYHPKLTQNEPCGPSPFCLCVLRVPMSLPAAWHEQGGDWCVGPWAQVSGLEGLSSKVGPEMENGHAQANHFIAQRGWPFLFFSLVSDMSLPANKVCGLYELPEDLKHLVE